MESDASCVMGYLMHYPEMESVQPVVELADMIRRGVILQDGVLSGALRSAVNEQDQPGPINNNNYRRNSRGGAAGGGRPPSWLLSSSSTTSHHLRGVGKQMSEKFSAVKSAVGSGLNALVDTVIEATSEQNHSDLQAAAAAGPSESGKNNKANSSSSSSNSGAAASARRGSNKEPVGDVDPLTGQPLNKSSSSSSSAIPSGTPIPVGVPVENDSSPSAAAPTPLVPPAAPLITGHGTGYGGALAGSSGAASGSAGGGAGGSSGSKKHDDDPFMFGSATSVTPAKLSSSSTSSSSSLFAPTSWFPSASSSSSTQSKQDKKKANRASGGVDLHTLQSNLKELDEGSLLGSSGGSSAKSSLFGLSSSSMKRTSDPAAAKSSSLANNNSVGDRLLELADQLVHPAYKSFPASSREGRDLQFEAEMRTETVKRLRALADVIAGLSSIVDYDMKFANAKLVSEPPPSAPAAPPLVSVSSVATSSASSSSDAVSDPPAVVPAASSVVDNVEPVDKDKEQSDPEQMPILDGLDLTDASGDKEAE